MNLREIFADKIHDMPIEAPASGQDGYTLVWNESLNKFEWVENTLGAHTHLEADITNLDKYTQAEIDAFFEGEATGGKKQVHWDNLINIPGTFPPSSHTHLEVDITDLDHYDSADFATDFSGADLANLGTKNHISLTNKNAETDYKHVTDNQKDALDNANSPTASNPVATLADTIQGAQGAEAFWFQSVLLNTPSIVTRLFGQSAEGFQPNVDIRLLKLSIQYYSEHNTQSVMRIRVFKYDGITTIDHDVLSVSISGTAIGYHRVEDITPDTNYNDLIVADGDTLWIEIDDGAGASANRVSQITVNLNYEPIFV